jgi:hypothetical protein
LRTVSADFCAQFVEGAKYLLMIEITYNSINLYQKKYFRKSLESTMPSSKIIAFPSIPKLLRIIGILW